jgi:predicted aspartyl protease
MSILHEKVVFKGLIGSKEVDALIDTGASHSFLRKDIADEIGAWRGGPVEKIVIADGNEIGVEKGLTIVEIRGCVIGAVARIMEKSPEQAVIGVDFLQAFKSRIDMENDKLTIKCPKMQLI